MIMYVIIDNETSNKIGETGIPYHHQIQKGDYLIFEDVTIRAIGIVRKIVHVLKGKYPYTEIYIGQVAYTDKINRK